MSRTRTQYRNYASLVRDQYYSGTPSLIGYQSQSPIVANSCRYSSIVDELTPVGSSRVVNPCTHTKCEGINGTLGYTISYSGSPERCFLTYRLGIRPGAYLPYQLPAGDWAGLASQLADQLNGRIDEGSLIGVSALEAAKTVAMIRNPFNLLKPDFRKAARHQTASQLSRAERGFSAARGGIKRASNIWLEHRYGWNALWTDIKAVAKTTAKIARENAATDDGGGLDAITNKEQFDGICQPYYYTAGDSPAYWVPPYSTAWYSVGAPGNYRCRLKTISSRAVYRVGCKQVVDAAIRWSRTKRLINAYGLDASSIASTLWEIVPFSFVVDWFIDPLGIWHSPSVVRRLHQSDVRNICSTLKIEARFTAEILPQGNPFGSSPYWAYREPKGGSTGIQSLGDVSFSKFTRYNDVPVSGGAESIFTDKDLSLTRRISGIALLAQKFI